MFKSKFIILVSLLCFTSGCRILSPDTDINPELEQRIDKIEGSQNTLENNQNAIRAEIGRLQNNLQTTGDDTDIQQGWLNVKADGMVVGGFAVITVGMLLYYMHKSQKYEKIATIMGDQIRCSNDAKLKNHVMAAAWNSDVERDVYKLID